MRSRGRSRSCSATMPASSTASVSASMAIVSVLLAPGLIGLAVQAASVPSGAGGQPTVNFGDSRLDTVNLAPNVDSVPVGQPMDGLRAWQFDAFNNASAGLTGAQVA